MKPLVIHDHNLSLAWGQAFVQLFENSGSVFPSPISVSVECPNGVPEEDSLIRKEMDNCLAAAKEPKPSSADTASTIFPQGLWNLLGQPHIETLSDIYLNKYYPKLRDRSHKNCYGTYFERLINYQGTKQTNGSYVAERKNQLEHIIKLWTNKKVGHPRHSSLQATCFDPAKDLTGQAMRGFPCLQQIAISYTPKHLTLNAFYHTEYIFDRGYGNYLGLCHLGGFLAHEMGLSFARLHCYIAHPELGDINKGDVKSLYDTVLKKLPKEI